MRLSLGYSGLVKGDIGNDLIAISEEPNARIMETKSSSLDFRRDAHPDIPICQETKAEYAKLYKRHDILFVTL